MGPSLIRVGIGGSLVSVYNIGADHFIGHSGEAFVTDIGVGKVIKGWDEGTFSVICYQKRTDFRRFRCPPIVAWAEGRPDRDSRLCMSTQLKSYIVSWLTLSSRLTDLADSTPSSHQMLP